MYLYVNVLLIYWMRANIITTYANIFVDYIQVYVTMLMKNHTSRYKNTLYDHTERCHRKIHQLHSTRLQPVRFQNVK